MMLYNHNQRPHKDYNLQALLSTPVWVVFERLLCIMSIDVEHVNIHLIMQTPFNAWQNVLGNVSVTGWPGQLLSR